MPLNRKTVNQSTKQLISYNRVQKQTSIRMNKQKPNKNKSKTKRSKTKQPPDPPQKKQE